MSQPASLIDHLRTRRSVPAVSLTPPGPADAELTEILTIASRVPDHGKLARWRFIDLSGAALADWLDRLIALWRRDNPDASAEAEEVERGKRPRAPRLVVLVSRAGEHPKIPLWEQQLAVGAVGMNLLHAVHAHGYAGQWLTGWPAYDPRVAGLLGLQENERIGGFFYLGTAGMRPADRDRPDVAALVTAWQPPHDGD